MATEQSQSLIGEPTISPENPNEAKPTIPGHPGHLTEQETKTLEVFRTQLTEAELYTPSQAGGLASCSDAVLLRFLRARKFDAVKAQEQFASVESWRKENDVAQLYKTFDVEEFESAKKYYPTFTGRRDKRGIPVYVYRLADLDSTVQKELSAFSAARRYQRVIGLYEYMTHGVLNLCTALATDIPAAEHRASGVPRVEPGEITSMSTIIDLSDVSLWSLWAVRGHLQQASELATANYPETLEAIYVVNTPSFFPTVWGWIKGWFDPGTRDKIQILGNPAKDLHTLEVLTGFIDKQNLPKAYGGDLDWTPPQPPSWDEPASEWLKEVMGTDKMPFYGPVVVDPYARSSMRLVSSVGPGQDGDTQA